MNLPYEVIDIRNINDKTIVVYLWDDLSEFTRPRIWENVECFDKSGQKLWTVNGMEEYPYWDSGSDTFTGIGYDGANWVLNSFSCHSFILDIRTGRVTYLQFNK